MGDRRRWLWLGAAVVLFGLAGYFMSGPDAAPKPELHVAFPRHQNYDEMERAEHRRTLLPLLALAAVDAGHKRLRPADPVLAALPPKGPGASVVVFEANAIRNSPLGELLLGCLRGRHHRDDPIGDLRQRTGIDLTKDLDRLAFMGKGVVVSGNFQNANWDAVSAGSVSSSPYGNQGTIYERPSPPNGHPAAMARWGNQMMIFGDSTEDVQQVIDRLEDRAPDAEPMLNESDTYGEVYGAMDPADVASMVPSDASAIADKIRSAAQQVKLHVDTTGDVAIVADVSGPDAEEVSDLGKTLGGALALARLKVSGDDPSQALLADLLDQAKVTQSDGSFRTELALPMSVLQKHLGWCTEALDGGSSPPVAP